MDRQLEGLRTEVGTLRSKMNARFTQIDERFSASSGRALSQH